MRNPANLTRKERDRLTERQLAFLEWAWEQTQLQAQKAKGPSSKQLAKDRAKDPRVNLLSGKQALNAMCSGREVRPLPSAQAKLWAGEMIPQHLMKGKGDGSWRKSARKVTHVAK